MTTLMGDLQKRIEDAVGSTGTFDESLQKLANLYGIAPSSNPSRIIPVAADFDSSITTAPAALNYLLYNPDKLPTLGLDFINNTTLDSRITFTRALNTATYFNSAGVLTTANANVARFDYDPSTLAPRGLLIEEARTNTLLQSRDMTQAAWTKVDVTPTRNQVGIDGVANTATLLTEGSAGTAIVQQSGAAVAAGATITGSVVLKRGNTDWVRVVVADTTLADGANAWFNLNTGIKGSISARGAGTSNSSAITSLGGGWYRCTVTTLPNGSYTIPAIGFISATADNSGTRVSGATYIVDCAQLEVGAFATSIIPTTTTTLTRNADVASVNTLSPWYNATEGTLYGEVTGTSDPAGTYRTQVTITDAGSTNYARFRLANPTATTVLVNSQVVSGGAIQADLASSAITIPPVIKTALGFAANNFAASTNGATPLTDLTGFMPINPTLLEFKGGTFQIGQTYIRRITYYPRRLSNEELQAITS